MLTEPNFYDILINLCPALILGDLRGALAFLRFVYGLLKIIHFSTGLRIQESY